MLKVDCYKCHNELEEPGGLIFSPAHTIDFGIELMSAKKHLCIRCWSLLEAWLEE